MNQKRQMYTQTVKNKNPARPFDGPAGIITAAFARCASTKLRLQPDPDFILSYRNLHCKFFLSSPLQPLLKGEHFFHQPIFAE